MKHTEIKILKTNDGYRMGFWTKIDDLTLKFETLGILKHYTDVQIEQIAKNFDVEIIEE